MVEFTAVAQLEARVTQDSLRSARRTIERELGDVEVGVGTNRPTGRGAVGARGPEPASLDVSRRQLGQQETLVDLAGERNDLLEEIAERSLGGGGGGRFGSAAGGAAGAAAGAGLAGLAAGGAVATAGALSIGALLVGLFGEGELNQNRPTGISGPGDQPTGGLPTREPAQFDVSRTLEQVFNINLEQQTTIQGPESGAEGRRQFAQEEFATSREVEEKVNTELQRFEQRLQQKLGGGSASRIYGTLGTRPGE